jgi:hypothetical protein
MPTAAAMPLTITMVTSGTDARLWDLNRMFEATCGRRHASRHQAARPEPRLRVRVRPPANRYSIAQTSFACSSSCLRLLVLLLEDALRAHRVNLRAVGIQYASGDERVSVTAEIVHEGVGRGVTPIAIVPDLEDAHVREGSVGPRQQEAVALGQSGLAR